MIPKHDFTDASLHRATVEWLVEKISKFQPKEVLEFGLGAGVGTRTILDNCESRVVSVEHQATWIAYAKSWNLYGGRLKIVGYNEIPAHKFDFVIIDGKDRCDCLIRHWDKIIPGAMIVLDDARRQTEQKIMKEWKVAIGLELEFINIGRGIGVGYK